MLGIFRKTVRICFFDTGISELLICNLPKTVAMPFYAVARGRRTGIYNSWADCEAQVKSFSGAKYKKFDTESGANEYMSSNSGSTVGSSSTYNHFQSGPNTNLKRSYATSSKNNNYNKNKSPSWNNEADSESSGDDLDVMINKQMDDLERRVGNFAKGLDEITGLAARVPHAQVKKTIFIQQSQSKKLKTENVYFEIDDEDYVQVYTDGACSSNGKKGARAGLGVFWGDGHPYNKSQPVSGRATNNCGEIQAATLAIKIALKFGIKKLKINTDSQFLINAVTKWLPGWKRRGWKLASGGAVKNELDFKDLDSVMYRLEIKWNYVKAHNGQHGNEMADRLAKEGAAMYK